MSMQRIVYTGLIGLVMVLLALFVHELGHIITATLFGAGITKIYVLGVQLYPVFTLVGFDGGYLGYVGWGWTQGTYSPVAQGFTLLMGSGMTLVFSTIWMLVLWLSRFKSIVTNSILVFGSLWYLDIVTYTFGLRFSGDKEPVSATTLLGVSPMVTYAAVLTIFLVYTSALGYVWYKKWRT